MSRIFANPLNELAEYTNLKKSLAQGKGPVQISGCMDSQKVHLMYETALEEDRSWKLVITYDEARVKEIYDDFRCFTKEVWQYPAKDLLFYSADIHGNLLTRQRIQVFKQLAQRQGGVIITTIDGLMDYLMPLSVFQSNAMVFHDGDTVNLDECRDKLTMLGYERVAQVDGMGQYSVRGGILDLFPFTEEMPVRIELWGDEIDSIRSFDLESQRSIEQLDQVIIYPATEMIIDENSLNDGIEKIEQDGKKQEDLLKKQRKTEEAARIRKTVNELIEGIKEGWKRNELDAYLPYFTNTFCSFLDYFSKDNSIVFLDEPQRLKERSETLEMEFRESMTQRLEKGYMLPLQTSLLYPSKTVLGMLNRPFSLCMTGLDQKLSGFDIKHKHSINVRNVNAYHNGFEMLIKDLKKWKKEKYRVILLSGSRTRASRIANDLREYELSAYCPDHGEEEKEVNVKPGEIAVVYGNLHKGFEYPLIKFVVITEGDMFGAGQKKRKKKKSSYSGQKIQSFAELAIGDYVVHEDHGLGIYRGIEKIEQDKIVKDYIKIEYGDGGKLYLPATKLEGIQKYAGADAKPPKLNKLGGEQWKKTKSRVKGAVQEIAKDLVLLYAARQNADGFVYGPDTVWQREFEELFPYEETEDQLEAIDAAKADMESTKIMDRLVCGDVGYGKTEIALRIAFKAIQEGKQVAYLVPTTILAQQHYNTFVQRMSEFPVRVDMMSRFRTPSEIKNTLEGIKKGMVDVVVGTHRILSQDVKFKNLGLLIIDEEQRFGVAHKEKIKKLKENVDVLTLTATPIPRTLHMSLIGIRDMSVLEEPPVDRVPIQTYVMEYNEEMIREAIHREIMRHGQVYYVYNRVNDIEEVAGRIAKLVPDANVVFAHGQMHEHQLERIMLDFVNGEIDVLVSTTIIETGLDIPNANTIIIHDADHMGLSQLYQLRGRVGRSNRTSYAFLMYKRDKVLKEEAEKRLQAIREFTELGSGIKIAMRDLEIRGAGNLLGEAQSGHMEAVGYDLYCKMLNQAVMTLKGDLSNKDEFETEIDCDIDAYIPDQYIKNEYQKLDIYKRICGIENEEERMDMQDELIDRFGDIPKAVDHLLKIASLKAMAHKAYVSEVKINRQEIRLIMYKNARLNVSGLPELVASYRGDFKVNMGEIPRFIYTDQRKKHKDCTAMMEQAVKILKEIGALAEE